MNTQSQEVPTREPVQAEAVREVEALFAFPKTITPAQVIACAHVEDWGRGLANQIATIVPQGREQMIAINSVYAAVVMARQGILKNHIELVPAQDGNPAPANAQGPA